MKNRLLSQGRVQVVSRMAACCRRPRPGCCGRSSLTSAGPPPSLSLSRRLLKRGAEPFTLLILMRAIRPAPAQLAAA